MNNEGYDNEWMFRTVFKFGDTERGVYGELVLGRDGSIRCYSHPNERTYRIEGERLVFLNASGEETSELMRQAGSHVFMSDGVTRLFLLPVVEFVGAGASLSCYPPVLASAVPKAGTYLVEAVLRQMGVMPINLHLGSHNFDDNRSTETRSIHWAPQSRRELMPAQAVAAVLQPG